MGYIEYLKGDLDANGNKKWYYRFYADNHEEVTEYFSFIGRKVRLKYCTVILSHSAPDELYEAFSKSARLQFYNIPELAKAQTDIDRCNNKSGCDIYCSAERRSQCSKLKKHEELCTISSYVREAINTPKSNYIDAGTKKDYDKKAASKMSYSSFESINQANSKFNVPRYKITNIVNNGNTCELVDVNGNKAVIDIVMILSQIINLKIHIVNISAIRNWKNFTQ